MISFKKSYAEQMLQLALALSLLQVDPESYLGRGWDTQLDIRNGDAWELEMLRAVPMTEYPYANRKAMIPLIEDLVRFDRQTTVSNYHDITAYLLNVQNAQNNQTIAVLQNHDLQPTPSPPAAATTTTVTATAISPPPPPISLQFQSSNNNSILIDPSPSGSNNFLDNNSTNFNHLIANNYEMDLFLNSEQFQDQIPLMEQNLADLVEYNDIPFNNNPIYFGIPLKDEPIDYNLPYNIKIEELSEDRASSSSSASTSVFPTPQTSESDYHLNKTKNLNETNDDDEDSVGSGNILVSWDDFHNIFKDEQNNTDTDTDKPNSSASPVQTFTDNEIKTEIKEEILSENENQQDEPLLNNVELTQQESEIVEVLWKQDVDLGFSLSPTKQQSAGHSSDENSISNKTSDDEVEQLKCLEELKLEKIKDELNKPLLEDEWAGIPFTIDNETGEYIRLPLQFDEILQDVLQFADLSTEDKHDQKEPTPSTSSAENKSTIPNDENLANAISSLTETINNNNNNDQPDDKDQDNQTDIQSIPSPLFDFEYANELDEEIDMMIQSAGPFHQHHRSAGQNYGGSNSAFRQSTGFHHHHHHHQVTTRVPLSRAVSMEQRLQDIANLFNPISSMGVSVGEMAPYSHYPNPYYQSGPSMQHGQFGHHPVLHNASLADIGGTQPHYGHNLGSAVSSSMHLTNSSHENDSSATAYKMEHDMMYYSNTSSELNHTTDGFINSILNDEDLQLMDMGVNESFCSMRMVDSNNATSNNSSVLGGATGGGHLHHQIIGNHLQPTMPNLRGLSGGIGGIGGGAEAVVGASLGSDGMGSSGDRLDASSDSAVSSMGSERVPSLSDGEWGEGSDSAQDYHQGKYGGAGGGAAHDYSYNSRMGDTSRQPPVAQKKHQMFGKRYFQDQPHLPTLPQQQLQQQPAPNHPAATQQNLDNLGGSIKYEYEPYATGLHQSAANIGGPVISSMDGAVGPLIGKDNHIPSGHWSLDFSQPRLPRTSHEIIGHNHSYTLPQGTGSTPRPTSRDKKIKKAEDEHLTRDEKRARALNVPIPVQEIINLPMDEFNERLSKYDLTENQLSLIRDIRRRGKNKVAAQNCRKRKLDQILSLEDEVKEVRRKKEQYYADRDMFLTEKNRISNKFSALHRHVFQYLRDPDGNLCSPTEYSLQQAADGSVYLLRRDTNKPVETNTSTNGNNSSRNYDTSSNSNSNHHYHHQQQQHHHPSQRPSPSSHHQKD